MNEVKRSPMARSPMVAAAAREMCRLSSEMCGVDNDDNWKAYGDGFLKEAAMVLDAAGVPRLVIAAQMVLADLNARIDASRTDCLPTPLFRGIADLHAAIAKATGAAK